MYTGIAWPALAVAAGLAAADAPESIVLTGVARDFAELVEKTATGGHPDFNPNTDAKGEEIWGCKDKPEAAKGAVQAAPALSDPNPDLLPGLVAYDRDGVGPVLKPGYDAPPNCYRSRFAEWYTTRSADINRAFFLDLTFVKEGSVYKYDNAAFFPLDDANLAALRPQVPTVASTFGHRQSGMKDGVDMAAHNFGFTFEFHAKFTYRKGTGQRFDFRGDDDVWVFINDRLVIDLGGLHPAEYAAVDLDTMRLQDDSLYYLDFYFAERRITSSRLTITTSLELKNSDEPEPPIPPIPPVPPTPVRAVEGWLYDRDGDGIADRAEVALDAQPDMMPVSLELYLAGEAERGNWDITLGPLKEEILSRADFFTKPVTGWNESDPANQGKALADPVTGLLAGSFPLHDRIGAIIETASKVFLDTSLAQVPKLQIQVRFSEPVSVGVPAVLKFRDGTGIERQVDLIEATPDSSVGGKSHTWSFTISPSSPNVPGEGWEVAVAGVAHVTDRSTNPVHPANPWKPIDAKLPTVVVGDLRAEPGGKTVPGPDPAIVKDPFVVLTSDRVNVQYKDYVPLHPETSEDWIRRYVSGESNPGLAVFGFKLSHPAVLEMTVFDNLGQFVTRSETRITREDLQSGRLARDPVTRAYLVRLGWYPVSHDGNRISTGAYILRAVFTYGLDSRDYVEKGSSVKVTRFGYIRENGLRGTGAP